jgi:hypothetical protein
LAELFPEVEEPLFEVEEALCEPDASVVLEAFCDVEEALFELEGLEEAPFEAEALLLEESLSSSSGGGGGTS